MHLASCSRQPVGTSHPFSQRRKKVTSIGSARVGYTLSPGFLECSLRVFPVRRELMGIFCSPILLGHLRPGRSRYPRVDVEGIASLLLLRRPSSTCGSVSEQFVPMSSLPLVVPLRPSPLTWRSA